MTGVRGEFGRLVVLATLAACAREPDQRLQATEQPVDAPVAAVVAGGDEARASCPNDAPTEPSSTMPSPPDAAGTADGPISNRLADRIPPPPGFARVPLEGGSFGAWLRDLPLKPGRPPVLLFDGRPKANQTAHVAVIDLSVGDRDLQQCADAVMRLRAEWLFSAGRWDEIAFDFTNGARVDFLRWSQGWRPRVEDGRVAWTRGGRPGRTHDDLLAYLTRVFVHAGSASLARELEPIDVADLRPGDLFIRGGFPGHAVLVVDLARDAAGRTAFLLAQSYMPAQEIHVLVNPTDRTFDPWYDVAFGDELRTPEWTFRRGEARRFPARPGPAGR